MALVLLLGVLLVGSPAFAQDDGSIPPGRSTIAGTVYDRATTEPLPNAIVALRSNDNAILRTASDATGRYQFERIAAGNYRVSAELDGYVRDRIRIFGIHEIPVDDDVRVTPVLRG